MRPTMDEGRGRRNPPLDGGETPQHVGSSITAAARQWSPTAAMMLLSLLSYVDRTVLAILSNTILADTKLSAQEYAQMISAFSAAYLVGNPLWGWALDRFGLRAGLFLAVAIWSGASTFHAFARGLLPFAVARGVLGFGEGATFPGGLRAATQTLRPEQKARGIALAYSGGSLGAIVTPLVVTPIALRWGWRAAFLFTGLLGVGWLVLWVFVSRDARVRRRPSTATQQRRPGLRDPSVWGFMSAYAFGGLPLAFVLYGAPIHLGRALHCSQATLGRVLWIPPLGWEVGYFWWGGVIDGLARRGRLDEGAFRRLFIFLGVLASSLAAAAWSPSQAVVLALLFFAMFVAAGFVIASLAEATRRHGEDHAAYLAGLGAGSWSALVAIIMPTFGRLFDHGGYRAAYAIAALSPIVGAVLWRGLRPRSASS
jgi:ACS family hexuronate transporter-like MFS transporter